MSVSNMGSKNSTSPPAGRYEGTFRGVLTAKAPYVPDVYTVLSPPVGRVVTVTRARLVVNAPISAPWRQHTFFFSRFVRITQGDVTLFNPNLDFLCSVPLKAGATGTFVGSGGVGPAPNPGETWTSWTQPLQVNSGVEVIFGCDLAVGNFASLELEWSDGGPGTSVVDFAPVRADGMDHVFPVGPPPPGTKWHLHNAFLRDLVTPAPGPRVATAIRLTDGFSVCEITTFPPGERVQSTGGYSTYQTGPALSPAGTAVVYQGPQWLAAGDRIEVHLTGPPGDKFQYAFSFTELPA
jgi:hypothetical protein